MENLFSGNLGLDRIASLLSSSADPQNTFRLMGVAGTMEGFSMGLFEIVIRDDAKTLQQETGIVNACPDEQTDTP